MITGYGSSGTFQVFINVAQSSNTAALAGEDYPVLVEIWDNEADAVFDKEVENE